MSFGRGHIPSAGNMAVTPKAEADCFWHSVQWQIYTAKGLGREAWKVTVPHWQDILAFSVWFSGFVDVDVDVDVDGGVVVDWCRCCVGKTPA
jgi:hypothetical protein